MPICKSFHSQWTPPTAMVRMVAQDGTNTVIFATDQAIQQFQDLELFRIIDMTIPGMCVKNNKQGAKYGVPGPFEVRLKYETKTSIASTAWPLKLSYNWTLFTDLNQCQDGEYVDVAGRVLHEEKIPQSSAAALQKSILVLGDDGHEVSLELLGSHVNITTTSGDVIAVKGARVVEWKHKRTLQTGFLTYLEVNPRSIAELPDISTLEDLQGQPRQKAIKLSLPNPISMLQTQESMKRMLQDVSAQLEVSPMDCTLEGKFRPLTDAFFEDDPPFVGDVEAPKVCLAGHVFDGTAELPVKIWTQAAALLLDVSVETLQESWNTGNAEPAKQTKLLEKLNKNMQHTFKMSCTAKVWKATKQSIVDLNVNELEKVALACQ